MKPWSGVLLENESNMRVIVRRDRSARLWRAYVNVPVYVPKEARSVLSTLETDGPNRLLTELDRLSNLGSSWASAVLGLANLLPDTDGIRNPARAIELCRNHAQAGDPYALFVYSWALLYSGDHAGAIANMRKAAEAGFPPATLDFATYAWNSRPAHTRNPWESLKLLGLADRACHKASWVWRCTFYRSGRFGVARRILGYLLTPFARLQYLLALWFDPFSCRVFMFPSWAKGPLLRDTPRYLSGVRVAR
jgi:hypothetical protein